MIQNNNREFSYSRIGYLLFSIIAFFSGILVCFSTLILFNQIEMILPVAGFLALSGLSIFYVNIFGSKIQVSDDSISQYSPTKGAVEIEWAKIDKDESSYTRPIIKIANSESAEVIRIYHYISNFDKLHQILKEKRPDLWVLSDYVEIKKSLKVKYVRILLLILYACLIPVIVWQKQWLLLIVLILTSVQNFEDLYRFPFEIKSQEDTIQIKKLMGNTTIKREDISSIFTDYIYQYSRPFPVVVLTTTDGREFYLKEMDKNNQYIKAVLLNWHNNP